MIEIIKLLLPDHENMVITVWLQSYRMVREISSVTSQVNFAFAMPVRENAFVLIGYKGKLTFKNSSTGGTN